MNDFRITNWCHHFIKEQIGEGDFCIDATAGKGNDTLLLCRLAGDKGQVLAFDIQQEALDITRRKLADQGLEHRARLICDSHVHIDNYAEKSSVGCIVFNFGYLPGGDHRICTEPESSVEAIGKGLTLLRKKGVMSLCIYSGGDTGFAERDTVLAYLKGLDEKKYLVIKSEYYNRKNNPPIPVFIIKL